MLAILYQLKQQRVITESDYYFAKLIADKQASYAYAEPVQQLAIFLAALGNHSNQQGNTCLFLEDNLLHNPFGLAYRQSEEDYIAAIQQKIAHLPVEQWQAALAGHIAFSHDPQQHIAPLVFQFNGLYFYRVWQEEYQVADYLKRAVANYRVFSAEDMTDIHCLFSQDQQSNLGQKIAIASALKQPFCLISGGPGTGKTFTVARLLVALQKRHQGNLRICLAAPTGKAAARLSESIENALAQLSLPDELRQSIPVDGMTIHRLLGGRYFKYNQHNPLPVDVLVVDEASMIDLHLMNHLLLALKPTTKLILLGDKDQLASVEAGAILGELGAFLSQGYSPDFAYYLSQVIGQPIDAQLHGNPIRDYLCFLSESRRFEQHSGIGQLADEINQKQGDKSWQLLQQGQYADLELVQFADRSSEPALIQHYGDLVINRAVTEYAEYLREMASFTSELTTEQVHRIFNLFKARRFLTALRSGIFGVEQLNQRIADGLQQQGVIAFRHSRDWYAGKPIMVVQNDSNVGLYNGDIGLFLGGKVWFEQGEGNYKAVSASRVPSHEPAFVMTVHKSQGSEFAHTFFVLPSELSPVLSKELVYTAVTRAKQRLTIFSSESIWKAAVRKQVKRQSGLGRLLQALLDNQKDVADTLKKERC